MKRAVFYRGCSIQNEKQRYLIVTPAQTKISTKNAESFEDCKNWIDRQLAHWAIEKLNLESKE